MKTRLIIAAMMCWVLIVSCGKEESNLTHAEPWPDRIELQVIDSIGADIGDSVYIFGAIGDVCIGKQNEILVLDQARGQVRVFTDSGDFIALMGGSGSGPGELSLPLSISCLSDGRIFVLDPMDNGYEIFDGTDYSFIEKVALWSNNPPMDPCGLDADCYLGLKFEMDQADGILTGISTLGRFGMDEAEPRVIYLRSEFPVDLSELGELVKNMLRSLAFTGDRNGRVFFSEMSTESYEVSAFSSDGSEIFHITADISPVPRSAEEMEEEKAYMENWVSRMGGMSGMPIEWEPEPFRWMIEELGVDGQDRLWIRRGTELMPVFDVFDMTGEHLFSARFPMEGFSWRFHIGSLEMLAWDEDPESGVQKVYMIRLP